jgi:hypothetical protein
MNWDELEDEQKALVIDVLEREAARLERDAAQLLDAATRLGRPSLVERHELRADAFRAAIDILRARH